VFTYLGVNLLLSGLHAYGSAESGAPVETTWVFILIGLYVGLNVILYIVGRAGAKK